MINFNYKLKIIIFIRDGRDTFFLVDTDTDTSIGIAYLKKYRNIAKISYDIILYNLD